MCIYEFVVWCYETKLNNNIIAFPHSRSPDFYLPISYEFKPNDFLDSVYLKNKLALKEICNISTNTFVTIIFYKE